EVLGVVVAEDREDQHPRLDLGVGAPVPRPRPLARRRRGVAADHEGEPEACPKGHVPEVTPRGRAPGRRDAAGHHHADDRPPDRREGEVPALGRRLARVGGEERPGPHPASTWTAAAGEGVSASASAIAGWGAEGAAEGAADGAAAGGPEGAAEGAASSGSVSSPIASSSASPSAASAASIARTGSAGAVWIADAAALALAGRATSKKSIRSAHSP